MTKRFTINKSRLVANSFVIDDKEKQYTFPTVAYHKEFLNSFCKSLNELSDENEQLKQSISDWMGSYEGLSEDVTRLEKENEQFKKKQLGLLRDEFRGYFGLLKHGAKNLSEKAIVEKIQRDINKILQEVFDDD